MTGKELLESIEVYQTQLQQIEEALTTAGNEEKEQLRDLQENLLQLLELTLQQLKQLPEEAEREEDSPLGHNKGHSLNTESSHGSNEGGSLDDEFALFKSEIAALSGENETEKEEREEEETENEEAEGDPAKHTSQQLEAMIGNHCRAPFIEKWGGLSYHNAVILNFVTTEDGQADLDDPQVRVLFSQPTSHKMLTCRFFLSGRCRYSDNECRFSHGTVVSVSDIKEYRDPDYDAVVPGSRVLVQQSTDLWANAVIQDILEDRSAFCVKYDRSKEVAEVTAVEMVPLYCESDAVDDALSDHDEEKPELVEDTSPDSSEDETEIFIPSAKWFQNSLSKRLGDWEKHTKGIGSKLMEKMGYVVGTGLGREGEGRVEPVTAYVYPQGVSLDRCMELREASNGEEMLQVEKRLDRQKRIEEAKSIQAAERLKKQTSVFDIINKKLGGSGHSVEDDGEEASKKPAVDISRTVLQKDSAKDLNMKSYHISENIRQLQREVLKMEETKQRQSTNKAALGIISTKLESKKSELQRLQDAERKVQGEQQKRRDTKKYCIF